MNKEQHQSSMQDGQTNQRLSAFSALKIPTNHGLGKLMGDLAQWTVPAAAHDEAQPTGGSHLASQPFQLGTGRRAD